MATVGVKGLIQYTSARFLQLLIEDVASSAVAENKHCDTPTNVM